MTHISYTINLQSEFDFTSSPLTSDECSTEGDDCRNGECRRTETGLRCVCDVGYFYNPSLRRCDGKIAVSIILQ